MTLSSNQSSLAAMRKITGKFSFVDIIEKIKMIL